MYVLLPQRPEPLVQVFYSTFSSRSIYVRSKQGKEGEINKTKLTASSLEPIKTAEEFEHHITTIADAVYRRLSKATAKAKANKKSMKKRINYYKIQLCILLAKEKIKPQCQQNSNKSSRSSSSSAPTSVITTSSNSNSSQSDEVSIVSKSTHPISKDEIIARKQKCKDPFKFPACSICIVLDAPIESVVKNVTFTGVPSGSMTKQMTYIISKCILKHSEQEVLSHDNRGYTSESDSSVSDDEMILGDEYFLSRFKLSKFIADIMKMTVEHFL